MTWFEDLSPCSWFDNPEAPGRILAVGWLEGDQPYTQGLVQKEVVNNLIRLTYARPWAPGYFLGFHECSLCLQSGIPREQVARGGANLFVPGEHCVYVAPSLIEHYIDVHGYAPPPPFCQAVVVCPRMNSENYFQALMVQSNGFLKRNEP